MADGERKGLIMQTSTRELMGLGSPCAYKRSDSIFSATLNSHCKALAKFAMVEVGLELD